MNKIPLKCGGKKDIVNLSDTFVNQSDKAIRTSDNFFFLGQIARKFAFKSDEKNVKEKICL